MRILLDKSAYSAFKRGNVPVIEIIRSSEEIVFSSVVAGAGLKNETQHADGPGTRFRRMLGGPISESADSEVSPPRVGSGDAPREQPHSYA